MLKEFEVYAREKSKTGGRTMTETAVAYSDQKNSAEAATEIAKSIELSMATGSPDALIVFASAAYDLQVLLETLEAKSTPSVLIGCSSAGEFISGKHGDKGVSAIAIRSDDMVFTAGLTAGLRTDIKQAAKQLVRPFKFDLTKDEYPYRSVLLLTDALAGGMDQFIEELTIATSGDYQFFGGGAGDDAKFVATQVFFGARTYTDAAVGLEILSKKPIGIGVRHGWSIVSESLRVTAADGMRLISINSIPALEFIEEFADKTRQDFDRANPLPFFIHNTIGIESDGGFKLRVPLAIHDDGSLLCAGDIPVGSKITMMNSTSASATEAAASAVTSALKQVEGFVPKAAIFFDCVATRLKGAEEFKNELAVVQQSLGPDVPYAGCNTYGQIARVSGQFNGFHNCSAVVCVIAD
jgi:hypothetical protein